MKTLRKVHLWTGIVVALFLLMQSITGLVLSNSRPAGQGPPWAQPGFITSTDDSDQLVAPQQGGPGFQGRRGAWEGTGSGRTTGLATVRELHEGRIGNYDFSLLLDIAAVGFVLVTVTGLILAYKVLKRPRSKLAAENISGTARGNPGSKAGGAFTEVKNLPDSPGEGSSNSARHPGEDKSDENK